MSKYESQLKNYKAFLVEENKGKFTGDIKPRSTDQLPPGDVLIKVLWSGLNYKDALSATGHKGVTKRYPHTPGVDAAGIIEATNVATHLVGEEVIVTGYDLGMNTPGGFGEYIRVPAEWIVKLPENLTLRESMILGTAGFTAGIGLYKLELNGLKEGGDLLITGSTGAVGALGVAIYAKAGYKVTASTGSPEKQAWLKEIGAANVIGRGEVDIPHKNPLSSGLWDGVLDTVGGNTLSTVISQTKLNCSVAACGLVQSNSFSTTVYPFIIRGVNLLGINSAEISSYLRLKVWEKLSTVWKPDNLECLATEITLDRLNPYIDKILQGKTYGKILIKVS